MARHGRVAGSSRGQAALKDVAWSNAEPFEVRAVAVELLADDSDPAGAHDTAR